MKHLIVAVFSAIFAFSGLAAYAGDATVKKVETEKHEALKKGKVIQQKAKKDCKCKSQKKADGSEAPIVLPMN